MNLENMPREEARHKGLICITLFIGNIQKSESTGTEGDLELSGARRTGKPGNDCLMGMGSPF